MLVKAAGAQKRNSAADDFLLRGRFARESWRAGAADTGRDKAEEGGIPAAVFRPTTTQDVPASVRLRACASRASRPFFLSRKKRKGGRFLFLKKRNKRHCGGEGSFGEKALSRTSDPIAHKNGRFPYEPSVLCSMFAKKTTAAKSNCSADDFLLRGRFARESWRAGAADTGRDKAEEGGIPAAVFRPTTTQDVPASVRLRACASRASRPVFLSRKKRKRKITRQCMDFSSLRTGGRSETITQSSVSTPTVSRL